MNNSNQEIAGQVRAFQPADTRAIWQIRNQPAVRSVSLNPAEISWSEHQVWFNSYLTNKNNQGYVLEIAGRVAGYCRFDKKDSQRMVSIALIERCQSRGMGSYLLRESIAKLPEKRNLLAQVKIANQKALNFFLKNGFQIINKDNKLYNLIKKDNFS